MTHVCLAIALVDFNLFWYAAQHEIAFKYNITIDASYCPKKYK